MPLPQEKKPQLHEALKNYEIIAIVQILPIKYQFKKVQLNLSLLSNTEVNAVILA